MSNLTQAQLAAFKTALNGDAALTTYIADHNWNAIVDYYNTVPASPTMLWRPSITIDELNTAIVWSEFAGLATAKQDAYMAMIQGSIDATKSNIRSGFTAVFSAAGSQTVTNLTAMAKRAATRFEALFSTSDGSGANTSAVYGVPCDQNDVINALGS